LVNINTYSMNCIGVVIGSVLSSSAVDCWFEPRSGKNQWLSLLFVASPINMKH